MIRRRGAAPAAAKCDRELADKHNPLAALRRVEQFLDSLAAKLRLQYIMKIFLAEKVQSVAANASQQRVQQSRGKRPVYRVIDGPGNRYPRDSRSTPPALRKALRIPSKKPHRAHSPQLQQRAFDAPVSRRARRRRIAGRAFRVVSWVRH